MHCAFFSIQWNEVILAFRAGMPRQKHRHHIRQYEDCFTASECISWLNVHLQNNCNFGPHVTRQQTMQLLQKFLKCRVIESVICKSSGKLDFKDNSHLYRFVQYTPFKPSKKNLFPELLRTPLSVRTNNLQNCAVRDLEASPMHLYHKSSKPSANRIHNVTLPICQVIEQKLSVEETEGVWKSVLLEKLQSLLSPLKIQDFCEESAVNGRTIIHNATRMSKTGVVILIDKTDDIPHWVMSAMKCLANWPEASGTGSCLPKYPGFEKDVFNVVKDYFLNPQISLVPSYLQPILLKIFCHFMHHDCQSCVLSAEQNSESPSIREHREVKTSTPLEQVKISQDVCIISQEGKLILDDSEAMWANPLTMCFETEFINKSPVTRLVPSNPLDFRSSSASLATLASFDTAADTLSTMSACSYNKHASKAKFHHSFDATDDKLDDDFCQKKFHGNLEDLSVSTIYGDTNKADIHRDLQIVNNFPNAGKYWTIGSNRNKKLTTARSELSLSHLRKKAEERSNTMSGDFNLGSNVQATSYRTLPRSPTERNLRVCAYIEQETKIVCNLEDMKVALQLLMLCLPVSNRRQIHLLLRMLNKISRNEKLLSDSAFLTKEFLLETFLSAVMDIKNGFTLNKKVAYDTFAYMMEECESIMKLPNDLCAEANRRLNEMKRTQIKYSQDDAFLTYCDMISKQQYEQQKMSASHQALTELLNTIIEDRNMSEKDKRKKLKQFKIIHPDIFFKRFPNSAEEEKVLAKSRVPLLTRFFSMRM